jgi:hypothetical protein
VVQEEKTIQPVSRVEAVVPVSELRVLILPCLLGLGTHKLEQAVRVIQPVPIRVLGGTATKAVLQNLNKLQEAVATLLHAMAVVLVGHISI